MRMKRSLFLLLLLPAVGCKGKDVDASAYDREHATVTDGNVRYRKDCLSCHSFTYAGTVWDTTNGQAIANVKVVIKALSSSDSLVLTTDSFGNFYTHDTLPGDGFEAYVSCGLIRRMPMSQTYGGCNDCHRPGGTAGRVIVCR